MFTATPLLFMRVINNWNGLSEDTGIQLMLILLFKTYLDKFYYDHQYDIALLEILPNEKIRKGEISLVPPNEIKIYSYFSLKSI